MSFAKRSPRNIVRPQSEGSRDPARASAPHITRSGGVLVPHGVIQEGGDDRISGTYADRHDDISHNGSSGFGDNADSAETADLGRAALRD